MTISAHIDIRTADPQILGYPESIFLNAKVVTVDAAFSIAEAVAIRDGKFLSIGTTREIQALAGPNTVTTDLQGATILPGLIDTHAHVEYAGRLNLFVDFAGITTVAKALERIAEHATRTPQGKWIRGNPWHPVSQLVEKRFLTREELDRAAPDHPICLPIGHFTLANSLALSMANVTRDTPDPEGGIIHRDADLARQCQFACTAQAVAVDGRNCGERQLRNAFEQGLPTCKIFAQLLGVHFADFEQIRAGAERSRFRRGEDHACRM